MKKYLHSTLAAFVILVSCQEKQGVDLVVTNATIWTGNDNQPWAEAIAISADTIFAVGSSDKINDLVGKKTELIDAAGQFITPGFIDCHVHFVSGGYNLASVQLRDAKTPEEFIQRIADYATTIPEGTWIMGGDWDHENWGGELPRKDWIDEVTPSHPVLIQRLDGHMSLSNSLALELAGVDSKTKDVEGGEIVRNDSGEPTGLLKDNAMSLVFRVVPNPSVEELSRAAEAAMNYVASNGVTTVHHMASGAASSHLEAFQKVRDEGNLITRIYTMFALSNWRELDQRLDSEGSGDEWLKIGGLKGFVDGSLGSHTAAFFDPYTDQPSDKGIYINPKDSLYQWVSEADKADLHIMVHAIGDDAINFLLNTYEKVQAENGMKDRRFRIEHAQHIDPDDIPRFRELDVIPSMQPYHAIDDGRWAVKLIGAERIKTTYAFKSLFDADALIAFGSDWSVAPATPLEGIYGAVTRRTIDGKNPEGWVPEQKISVEQALTAYTTNAAYASFEEDIKGTLEPGKLADFVIIDQDITKIDPVEIRNTRVMQTYVGGKKVYDAETNN